MKTAAPTASTFRLRKSTGFVSLRDLWSFAWFVAGKTGEQVEIEGVSGTRAGHINASVPLSPTAVTSTSKPVAEVYRPRARRGLALKSDLRHLDRWLAPILADRWASDDKLVVARRADQSRRLPLPTGDGLLLRGDLLPYLQEAGKRLGVTVEASDISGSRDTGAGFKVNRHVRVASLEIEIQERRGYGKACYAFLPDDLTTGYVTVRVITYTHANGSYTETFTASGLVQGVGPGGVFDACDEVTFGTTFDEGFDYGTLNSVDTSDTLVAWDDVIAAAEAELDDDGSPIAGWTHSWNEEDWPSASGTISEYISFSSSDNASIYGELSGTGWTYAVPKFRIHNTGDARIELEITHTRASDSATETPDPIVVEAGTTSDWIELRIPDPFETWNTSFTSLSIGGL